MHSGYLGREIDWARVVPVLVSQWNDRAVMRIRSQAARQQLLVQFYTHGARWFERWRTAVRFEIDCASRLPQLIANADHQPGRHA
jgi:hypothetical protein